MLAEGRKEVFCKRPSKSKKQTCASDQGIAPRGLIGEEGRGQNVIAREGLGEISGKSWLLRKGVETFRILVSRRGKLFEKGGGAHSTREWSSQKNLIGARHDQKYRVGKSAPGEDSILKRGWAFRRKDARNILRKEKTHRAERGLGRLFCGIP